MTILNLPLDIQKEILDYIPVSQKAPYSSASKASMKIVRTVDETFKKKAERRIEIQNLKKWAFAKLIFAKGLRAIMSPVMLAASVVCGVVAFLIGCYYDVNNSFYIDDKRIYYRDVGWGKGWEFGKNVGSFGVNLWIQYRGQPAYNRLVWEEGMINGGEKFYNSPQGCSVNGERIYRAPQNGM